MICDLCGQPNEPSEFARDHGQDQCALCRSGHVVERMAATGLVVLDKVHSRSLSRGGSLLFAHVTVTGKWAYPFHAELSREKLKHTIISLFKDELEVGDPLFDDNVWVETADPSGTGRLLQSQGAQSALLQLVGMPSGKVIIGPGELRSVQEVSDHDQSLDAQILATCALARHLQPLA